MVDKSRFSLGSHEQRQVSPEEKQLLANYAHLSKQNFMNRLRVVVWNEDPNIVYEEDGIPKPVALTTPEQPTAQSGYDASTVTNNVVYLANRQEEQVLTEQQRMEEEARRNALREAA